MTIDWLPDSFLQWVSILTIAAFGVLAAINIFDKTVKTHRSEAEETETRLVNALKDEVAVMGRRMEDYEENVAKMREKISKLETENTILRELITGNDKDSRAYRQQAIASMDMITQIAKIVSATQENINKLYQSINSHLRAERKKIDKMVS